MVIKISDAGTIDNSHPKIQSKLKTNSRREFVASSRWNYDFCFCIFLILIIQSE